MTAPLTDRERQVLEAVIETYVQTAEPAGSRTIATRHQLGLSPATIRNTMSDLEDKGYLYHPHTSAGRIPTDLAYRVYVDFLMRPPVEGAGTRAFSQSARSTRRTSSASFSNTAAQLDVVAPGVDNLSSFPVTEVATLSRRSAGPRTRRCRWSSPAEAHAGSGRDDHRAAHHRPRRSELRHEVRVGPHQLEGRTGSDAVTRSMDWNEGPAPAGPSSFTVGACARHV
jgi:hypothetical protein